MKKKRQSNIRKHGIDFEYAKDIWNGPTVEYPARSTENEIRRTAVGQFGPLIIAVVYTDRSKRRIISARRASRKERADYDNEIR